MDRLSYSSRAEELHISSGTVKCSRRSTYQGVSRIKPHRHQGNRSGGIQTENPHNKVAAPPQYLRSLMGEGTVNHTIDGLEDERKLLNPGENVYV